MRTTLLRTLIAGLTLVVPMTAGAATSVSVQISTGTAPPPPSVSYREMPKTFVVPNTTVHVVSGTKHSYDYFRYGVYWYIHKSGHWYRARKYQGPFTVVERKYVPRAIITVPTRYWKAHPHGAPPGQVKKAQRKKGKSKG